MVEKQPEMPSRAPVVIDREEARSILRKCSYRGSHPVRHVWNTVRDDRWEARANFNRRTILDNYAYDFIFSTRSSNNYPIVIFLQFSLIIIRKTNSLFERNSRMLFRSNGSGTNGIVSSWLDTSGHPSTRWQVRIVPLTQQPVKYARNPLNPQHVALPVLLLVPPRKDIRRWLLEHVTGRLRRYRRAPSRPLPSQHSSCNIVHTRCIVCTIPWHAARALHYFLSKERNRGSILTFEIPPSSIVKTRNVNPNNDRRNHPGIIP